MQSGHVDQPDAIGLERTPDAANQILAAGDAALAQLLRSEQLLAHLQAARLPESFAIPDDSRAAMVYAAVSVVREHESHSHVADTLTAHAIGDPRETAQSWLDRESAGNPQRDGHLSETLAVAWPAAGYRFRILRPHARGGLGQVLLARDLELNRDVALKQIQDQFADEPENRSRFVLEAEVTGNLEHPGIVPIYGLGAYSNGRPFYAMRFIRGQSLLEAIQRFHATTASLPLSIARGCSVEHNLEFRKLLSHFLAVCQTIAYAHSRGVLHRDIKPGNIMLGSYGETLVVDWGLARTGHDEPANDPSAIRGGESQGPDGERIVRRSAAAGSHSTLHGTVVGTPGYLSPEQADGRHEDLSPASDVYSLGATLYCLLVGNPPLAKERDVGAVLRKTLSGEIPRPRQLKPGVPLALEAICLKAMANSPADRYRTPTELASDLEKWLADEPILAHREPLGRRMRRWLRNHPRTVTASCASVFVGLASLALVAMVVSDKNDQLSAAYDRLQAKTLSEIKARQETERAHHQEAQARRQAEAAEMVANYLIGSFSLSDAHQDGRKLTVAEALQSAVARLDSEFQSEPVIKSHLLQAFGKTYQNLGLNAQAEALLKAARRMQDDCLRVNDLRSLCSIEASLNRYAAGKLDMALPLLEETLERHQAVHGSDDPRTLEAMNNLALGYLAAGRLSASITLLQQSLERRRALLGLDHPDTHCAMNNLARAYHEAGRSDEALTLYEDLLNRRRQMLPDEHPLIAISLNNLAAALTSAGKTDQALPLHEEALRRTEAALGAEHPHTHAAMNNLAQSYHAAGEFDKALPLWEQALSRQRKSQGDQHASTLVSMHNLATAYRSAGRTKDAIPLLENVHAAVEHKLGADHPDAVSLQKELSEARQASHRVLESKTQQPSSAASSPWRIKAWPAGS